LIRSRIHTTALALWSLTIAGCVGGPIQNLDVEFDCNDVCGTRRFCFDATNDTPGPSTFDRAGCEERCKERAWSDPGAADQCAACLEDRSCTDLPACASACDGLL